MAKKERASTGPGPGVPTASPQGTPEPEPEPEPRFAVTLRLENTYEYHLQLPRSQIEAILDPSVPDQFIEVPLPPAMRNTAGTRRFLQTAWIKEIDVKGL